MATLPAQTRRFKLRISAISCQNSSDLFLDTKAEMPQRRRHTQARHPACELATVAPTVAAIFPCPVRTQQSGGRSPLGCCASHATKCKNNYDSKQQSPPTFAIARRLAVLNGARAAGCMIGRSGRGSRSAA